MATGATALVFDASALIDLVDTDARLLTLIGKHVAPVIVPEPILREVSTLDQADCRALGLTVVEPTLSQLQDAAVARGRLSEEDWPCLFMARDQSATCVTSDGALHRTCRELGIDVWRGLRPLIVLVQLGVLEARAAIMIVRSIQATNAYITVVVVHAFVAEVRAAARIGRDRGRPE